MWLRTCAWLARHTIQALAKLSFLDLPEISLTVIAQDWTLDILRSQPMGCFMWNHPVGTASPGWMGRWAKRDGMGQVFAGTPNIGWIGMVLILQHYKWPKSAVPWVLHLGPYPFDFINCDFQIANIGKTMEISNSERPVHDAIQFLTGDWEVSSPWFLALLPINETNHSQPQAKAVVQASGSRNILGTQVFSPCDDLWHVDILFFKCVSLDMVRGKLANSLIIMTPDCTNQGQPSQSVRSKSELKTDVKMWTAPPFLPKVMGDAVIMVL